MVSYNYLGYGVTDENGVAKLKYDSEGQEMEHSYTGVGAGEIDVLASLDNPIIEGSIVSGTLPVLDCYKYDSGTDPNNNIWTIAYGTLTRDATNGYSILKESATNDGIIAISSIPLTDYHLEVDIFQVDGTANRNVLQILNNDYSPVTGGYRDGALGEWKHFDIDLNDLAVNTRVRLVTGNDCTELRFKNFKLYPI